MTAPLPPVGPKLPDVIQRIKNALDGKWGFRPTPGPWYGSFDGVYEGEDYGSIKGTISRSCATRGKTEAEEANNVYTAACNPENMRVLLSAISAHEAEVGRLRELIEEALGCWTAAEIEGLHDLVAEAGDGLHDALVDLITRRLSFMPEYLRAALTQGETK